MSEWWHDDVVAQGKLPLLILFGTFVLTFLVTRAITRLIRAGRGPFRNVTHNGMHVHHSVPGIALLVIGAFVAVGAQTTAVNCVAAALVGVGTSLVLDEFALILHLSDVYWAAEGRTSVEMVSLAAACLGFALVGITPISAATATGTGGVLRFTALGAVVLHYLLVVVAVLKGKYRFALIGCFVPLFAWAAGLHLARPGSWWGRHYGPERRARAAARAARFDARWDPLLDRLSDIVAGHPGRAGGRKHRHPPG